MVLRPYFRKGAAKRIRHLPHMDGSLGSGGRKWVEDHPGGMAPSFQGRILGTGHLRNAVRPGIRRVGERRGHMVDRALWHRRKIHRKLVLLDRYTQQSHPEDHTADSVRPYRPASPE